MTTTAQQQVLTEDEIECLRLIALGRLAESGGRLVIALRAKGMLDGDSEPPRLTPAGQHAVDACAPGTVPGLDN